MASFRSASALKLRQTAVPALHKRSAHDLMIQHKPSPSGSMPARAIIRHGPPTGGRSAQNGQVATVFGCTGFLGRYLVHKLAKQGTQVVVPYRDEDSKRHLKVMGDLGQIVPLQIEECVRHSDVVYNLASRDWETRNFTYEDVNVTGPELIARVCREAGVPRFVHVSHLNAASDSPSAFYRTKYEGERRVRDAFGRAATIVRPGPLFGAEDWLLNGIACELTRAVFLAFEANRTPPEAYPTLFHLNNGQTRTRPAHVLDVAEALNVMLTAPRASDGATFALPGPRTYTHASLVALVEAMTLKSHMAPNLPKPVAMAIATVLNRALWWPTVSPDEVIRKYIDDAGAQVAPDNQGMPEGWAQQTAEEAASAHGIDGEAVKGWQELNIDPETVEEHAIKYLRRFRSAATFDAPVELGSFKAPKTYHVVE
ncbi:hypothetical protein QFC19_000086 [Naganishia cerealis]|uniref:Uncharacterized protein n=1 Tax=Naganishia cerealis TaxID=610337 RepID=A0ACC2WS82_9TREE|nr:hypothetical protein QFC19_000086 [Naganishia cerealis]